MGKLSTARHQLLTGMLRTVHRVEALDMTVEVFTYSATLPLSNLRWLAFLLELSRASPLMELAGVRRTDSQSELWRSHQA